MNRKKALAMLFDSYKKEEILEKKEKKWFNLLKFLLRRVLVFLSIKFLLLLLWIIIFLLPFFIIIFLFLNIGKSDITHQYTWWYDNYSYMFNSELIDVPIWIPVERGRLTRGYDYTRYNHPIVGKFLKMTFWNEYYSGHQWIDFGKTFTDKIKFYKPTIVSTNRWIVYQYEDFDESTNDNSFYSYLRITYANWIYSETTQDIKKNISSNLNQKPYWKHVIITSIDWRFYVMYAHLSSINKEILANGQIERGSPLWKMGTTGNSNWDHLHYEIRYCGENNFDLSKTFRQCYPINPLWFVGDKDFTYLGIKEMPKNNNFTAWNIDIKDLIKDDLYISKELTEEKELFCETTKLLFLWKKITCNEIFPIYFISKDNEIFPKITDDEEKKIAATYYLKNEYWNIELNKENIKKISLLEWVSIKDNKEDFLYEISNKISYWKYNNKNNVYLINNLDILDSEKIKEINQKQLMELIDYIDILNKKNSIENVYINYFYNQYYKNKENPYVYNFIDENSIFLEIKDFSWNKRWNYNKDGVLTIYQKIKK